MARMEVEGVEKEDAVQFVITVGVGESYVGD